MANIFLLLPVRSAIPRSSIRFLKCTETSMAPCRTSSISSSAQGTSSRYRRQKSKPNHPYIIQTILGPYSPNLYAYGKVHVMTNRENLT